MAFVFRFADWIVSFVPTYRDTARGRKNALQIRAGLLVCGVLIVGFAGRTWVAVGVTVMALALIAPMAEMRRRLMRSKLKRAQTKIALQREGAKVVYDGRRVLLLDAADKNLRRVLTRDHEILRRNFEGRRAVGIKGPGSKKKEQIWLVTEAPASDDLQPLVRGDVDMFLEADAADVDELLAAMESA